MLDQQPRYDSYRDSGVDWIGSFPCDWSIVRNGALFREVKDPGNDDLPILSVSIHSGVSSEELTEEENIRSAIKIADRTSYKEVKPGYIAYNMMRAWQGGIGFVSTHGMVSPAYVVAKPIVKINAAFFEYLYRTDLFIGQMDRFSKGITDFRKRLYWEEFKTLLTVVPPLAIQDRIVSFLDKKTAEIDAAIEKKRLLIDLLNEQKAILINRAVTKGLNPDAPMKDSGVDWIGEIPAHWDVKRTKFLTRLKSGDTITADAFVDEGFPVYGGNGFRGFSPKYTHSGEHVLIGRQGALCGNVNYASEKFFASEHAIVATPKAQLQTHWLGEVLRVANLGLLSQSAAQPGISVEAVGNVIVPVPPSEEQTQMEELFTKSDDAFADASAHVQNEIATLDEFKQTLIANAVTGKIKI